MTDNFTTELIFSREIAYKFGVKSASFGQIGGHSFCRVVDLSGTQMPIIPKGKLQMPIQMPIIPKVNIRCPSYQRQVSDAHPNANHTKGGSIACQAIAPIIAIVQ